MIFVLQGINNCGKTTVLKMLIKKLTESPQGSFICQKDKDKFERADNVTLPILYKGKLIAITTFGDCLADVQSPYLNYKDCAEIFVCAAHPTGRVADYVAEWQEIHTVKIVPKRKVPESQHEKANEESVLTLFQEIDRYIEYGNKERGFK